MSSGVAEGIRISAIACSVPNNSVANDHFVSLLGTEQMAKFEKMVGVVQRRLAPDGMTTSSLAISAGRKLIEDGSFRPDTIDAVLFVSQTPDYVLPATACVVQSELGVGKSAIAFDINLGCSGFTYGVFVAASLLKMEGVSKVLLCGGDVLSKIVDPADAASAPLFGDAGFAAVVERDVSAPPMRYAMMTDGSGHAAIECRRGGFVSMNGMDVFNFAINEVPDLISREILTGGFSPEEIDFLVLHQANLYVLKQIALMTGFPMSKVPVSINRYGNTSSASIPLTLCDMASPSVTKAKVLMCGFGVGLSWGTLLVDFDFSVCHPIVEL